MKLASLLFAGLLLAGCSEKPPFKIGDTLVANADGSVLGTVIEVGDHSFANGASGPSIHIRLPAGGEAWYSTDTTEGNYAVKK